MPATGGFNVAASPVCGGGWPMRSLGGTLRTSKTSTRGPSGVHVAKFFRALTGLPLARHPPPVCYERSLFSTASCGCRGPLPTCLCSGPLRIYKFNSRLPTPLTVPPPFSKWLETSRIRVWDPLGCTANVKLRCRLTHSKMDRMMRDTVRTAAEQAMMIVNAPTSVLWMTASGTHIAEGVRLLEMLPCFIKTFTEQHSERLMAHLDKTVLSCMIKATDVKFAEE